MELVDGVPDLATVRPEDLSLVYSGRAGCGCGCRGTYREDLRNRRRVLKAIREAEGEYSVAPDGPGQWIFARERAAVEGDLENRADAGRYYWAYTRPDRVSRDPTTSTSWDTPR